MYLQIFLYQDLGKNIKKKEGFLDFMSNYNNRPNIFTKTSKETYR